MNRSTRKSLVTAMLFVSVILAAGVARAVDHASIEMQLIWGSNDAQSPDPSQKPVEPAVQRLLASSPYRWQHYYEVNKRVEDIESDKSKDKIVMSSHCELDVKYLGNRRVQVKLYGDGKLLSTHREALPLLLAGDARNDTAWLVLIRMAEPRGKQTAALVTPAEAQTIEEQFQTTLVKAGSPRILIYVNRDLVGSRQAGLRLSARSEKVETTRSSTSASNATVITRSTANNTYSASGGSAPTLADRQTVRDVERLMGGPFRTAGATLVDQGVAAQLIGDRPLESLTLENDQARKDREAVGKIADVALEVLISSRPVVVADLAGGNKTYNVPDIQATAIRLSDSKVIGQAASADVLSKAGSPTYTARNFGVEAITEATALSLMDDMTSAAR